jgi:hypothetical protein
MKSAILNLFVLSIILFLTLFLAFMSPLSSVSHEVPPPDKTTRHIELESLDGYSRSEMDELRSEREQFQQKWKEKASEDQISTSDGFETVINKMQIPFVVVIFIFALFFKWKSVLDTISVLLGLSLFSLLFPLLSSQVLICSVVFILLASIYKANKSKAEPAN